MNTRTACVYRRLYHRRGARMSCRRPSEAPLGEQLRPSGQVFGNTELFSMTHGIRDPWIVALLFGSGEFVPRPMAR
jgi:hypothetical protein